MTKDSFTWCSLSFLIALSALFLLAGCTGGDFPPPARLSLDPYISGNNQAALQGELLAKPFVVLVEGPQEPGLLGGKGSRHVLPRVKVQFSLLNPESGAQFESESEKTTSLLTQTDAGGTASAQLRLGHSCGDVWVQASLPDYPEVKEVRFRAVSGVQVVGENLEAVTQGKLDAFGVRLQHADGTPAQGVEVLFRTEGVADGAKVGTGCTLTDETGLAQSSWTLGKKVRQYYASVEIHDTRRDVSPEKRFDVRAIEFIAMATNKRQMFIVLFGGLGIFIFGMKLMSEGLQRMADRRLKTILNFMTQNRFMAVGAGLVITAMIQSSSATTVMTVGFVNAGLVTFRQAIGVVFGANIGTTVTAQIIAFKLDALAYPSIAVGLVMMALIKRPQWKAFGQTILGFGLLFLGMTTMSGILKPLRHSPEFVSWFHLFDCSPDAGVGMVKAAPALMCILIGTITTVVVQSSSATVGLVLALSSQGLISFYTAVPLILGDNIGTTITANFAAIGTNRNARRAALAHTMFNVVGALYMYLLLFVPFWHGQPVFLGLVDWITPGEVFSANPENLLRHVANSHTTFNIINVLLFIPFVSAMARLCEKIIPVTEADADTVLQYLEPNLLKTPSIALEQAVKEVVYMLRKGQAALNDTCNLLCDNQEKLIGKIKEREELMDRLQREITEYLVALSRKDIKRAESALIPALVHAVNDAERLGDHAEELVELHALLKEGHHEITQAGKEEIRHLQSLLNEQFAAIFQTLEKKDLSGVDTSIGLEAKITEVLKTASEEHVKRLEAGRCSLQGGVVFLDALAHLERIGDHLLNIAERAGVVLKVTEE